MERNDRTAKGIDPNIQRCREICWEYLGEICAGRINDHGVQYFGDRLVLKLYRAGLLKTETKKEEREQ